jgi:membrane protease YdiL (CAAX protease family)
VSARAPAPPGAAPGFRRTVRLLLGAARRRADGRRRRQRELLGRRAARPGSMRSDLGFLLTVLVMAGLNVMAAFLVKGAVGAGERVAAERQGWVVVDGWFADQVAQVKRQVGLRQLSPDLFDTMLRGDIAREATALAAGSGGDEAAVRQRLVAAVRDGRGRTLLARERAAPGLTGLESAGPAAMLGSLALLGWSAMLVLQGEGLELDVQRRRHPMWEWAFSHPVPAGAVFLAEMLAPIVVNPVCYSAPLLPAILYGSVYGPGGGMLAAVLVGVPLVVAAACLGRALDVAVMLRCAPRSRGALVGVMGWLGYSALLLLVVGFYEVEPAATALAGPLAGVATLPWPWLGLFLGRQADGSFSFAAGVGACASLAALTVAASVSLGVWAARQGLGGRAGRLDAAPARRAAVGSRQRSLRASSEASKVEAPPSSIGPQTPPKARLWSPLLKRSRSRGGSPLAGLGGAAQRFRWPALAIGMGSGGGAQACLLTGHSQGLAATERAARRLGTAALYRKELKWFARDRSAIVQVLLLPLTMLGFQLFNLRGVLAGAAGQWNTLCGGAVLFGTYFLLVLGPKSLASEGAALWIAQTWPRGLEDLLRAKAWLWTCLSTGVVALALGCAAWMFPADIAAIALVGGGWFLFARSMADKAVTLATMPNAAGEPGPVPRGRAWAAQLGTFTFAVGVLTRQWPLAVTGVVYSTMTAAAMWQNFRARLPFLNDPWSERLPPAPSLMHAMIAISILVEGGAVLTGAVLVLAHGTDLAVARAMIYAACAAVTAIGTARFLAGRGVPWRDVWVWPRPGRQGDQPSDRPGNPWAPPPWSWRRPDVRTALRLARPLLAGAALGVGLGGLGRGYVALLHRLPSTAEILARSDAQMAAVPHLHASYFAMAVLVAPLAEEYLFRGLLYRALDREWGGWRAIAGSAAFFAIYHPALSWLPVGALGVANALLFRRTGYLAPAVLLHMAYNAVVLA